MAACSSGSNNPTTSSSPPAVSPPPTDQTTPPGSNGGGTESKLPLGDFTLTSGSPSCALGGTCRLEFTVDCPKVQQAAEGTLIAQGPGGNPKGIVLGFIGTRGTGTEGLNQQWVTAMTGDGYEVIVVSWDNRTPWLQATPGEEVGPKLLACRPATAIKWIHDNIYDQLGSQPKADGVCGFCMTGNSGGGSQIAYSLSFYGVAGMVDAAVLTGGPPHTSLDQACLGPDPDLQFDFNSASLVDLSYGFLKKGSGPCTRHDQSFADKWHEDSVDVGGTYRFPHTRIVFIFVAGDHTPAPPHGTLYYDQLKAAGSPLISPPEQVPGTGHTIMLLPEGRAAVEAALVSA